MQPFHLAFPVRDLGEARDFYGGCVLKLCPPPCSFEREWQLRMPSTTEHAPNPTVLLLPTLSQQVSLCRKLGCPEGRSAATWVDYSLFGHQIVCHHVKGYSAVASRNAGAWCLSRLPVC